MDRRAVIGECIIDFDGGHTRPRMREYVTSCSGYKHRETRAVTMTSAKDEWDMKSGCDLRRTDKELITVRRHVPRSQGGHVLRSQCRGPEMI